MRLLQARAEGIWAPSVKYSDQLANGDRDDDKELEKEHDMTDDIVDVRGHTNAGYGHTEYDDPEHFWKFDKAHYETNHVKSLFSEHFSTVPRDPVTFTNENVQLDSSRLWDPSVKYSDQLANGDRDDDKELEKEHDMTDDIVDYNGHTNYGYHHIEYDDPEHFWKFDKAHYETNHVKSLFPEHFSTVPRDPVTFTNDK